MYSLFEKLCSEKGVTPYRVCKGTGISTSTLSNWKAGRYTPKQDKLKKIADFLGVSVDYLITGKEEDAVAEEKSIDLKDEFNRLEKMLKSGEVTPLYFDGQPVDQESINLLLDQIKISVAFIAKQRKK